MPAWCSVPSTDRRALVTGGSGAIGSIICRALARDNCTVIVGFHERRAAAEAIAQEIREEGGEALSAGFDLADSGCADSIREHIAAIGGVDIVVHAAARNVDGLAVDLDPFELTRLFAVNVTGVFHVLRAALPWLLRSDQGRIILLSSVLASRGTTGVAGYAATKGAIEAMTRALAVELGGRRITVNAVAPGFIDAGLGRAPIRALGPLLGASVPLRRAGSPVDVAEVVRFLASPAAAYVTGTVIPVDGGLLAGSGKPQAHSPVAPAQV